VITAVGALGLAAATGMASALLPVVNAEAYALVTAARPGPAAAWTVVVALAVGQTAGKLVLFESARRGATQWLRRLHGSRRRRPEGSRAARWSARATTCLRSRSAGPAVVLASASVGLPPLAVVSLAAGAAGQRRVVFTVACLVGRTARFAALAAPVIWAAR
jgi:membrane protein YqaA with SNARE-associated domain